MRSRQEKKMPGHAVSFMCSVGTAAFATAQLALNESNESAAIFYATSGLLFIKGVYDLHQENRLGKIYNDGVSALHKATTLLWQQPKQVRADSQIIADTFKPAL